jgi:ribose transport system substrate-binding protein
MQKVFGNIRSRAVAVSAVLVFAVAAAYASGSQNARAARDAAAAKQSSGLAVVEAKLKPWLTLPTKISVTQRLKRLPKGTRVDFLECSAAPCVLLNGGLKEASQELGMDYTGIPAGGTPTSFQAAAQQAVNQKPAVVIMPSLSPSLLTKQLAEMKAEHILTVDFDVTPKPAPGTIGQLWESPGYNRALGGALGLYALAHSDLNAHVLYVNQSIYSFGGPLGQGVQQTLQKYCPKCTYTSIDSLPQDIGGKIPTSVVSEIQANRSINWVVFEYGAMTLGVPQALKAAGLTGIHILSQGQSSNNFQDITNGTEDAVGNNNYELFSDYVMNAVARAVVGQTPPNIWNNPRAMDIVLVTKKEINSSNVTQFGFNPVPNFKQQFRKLWGIH